MTVAFATLVRASTDIAKLVAAAARHVVAAFVLLNPEATLGASLRADCLGPLFQLSVLVQILIVDMVCPSLKRRLALLFLELIAGLLHMVYRVAA